MYEYKCLTIRVIDGNTIDAEIDLGFNVLVRQRIKLHGVLTPDIKSFDVNTKESAQRSKARLIEIIGKEFFCQTVLNKRGKAGRTLGHVFLKDLSGNRINVNQQLIDEGLATRYGD